MPACDIEALRKKAPGTPINREFRGLLTAFDQN